MPMRRDYLLYLVTDREYLRGRRLADIVQAAVAGGVTCVQLREKAAGGRGFLDLARQILAVTRPAGVPLIINDRVDVMLAAGAEGVHVGQEDLPADAVRDMIGPEAILGVTVADMADEQEAIRAGADYVGTNAVFATPTKTDTGTPTGLEGLRALCAASHLPVVAIGGIEAGNAGSMVEAGAAGAAVVRAIMAADDPEAAARELRRVLDRARRQRQSCPTA